MIDVVCGANIVSILTFIKKTCIWCETLIIIKSHFRFIGQELVLAL